MSEFANYEAWATAAQAIAVAMTAQGLNAALEYQFIAITLTDGRYIAFGDVNDTWMGEIYKDQGSFGDPLDNFDTGLSTDTFDPMTVATAAAEAIAKLPPPPTALAAIAEAK